MSTDTDRILDDEIHETFEKMLRSGNNPCGDTTIERYHWEIEKWADYLQTERGKTVWEATTSDLRSHLRELQADGYADGSITPRRSAISQFYQQLRKAVEDGGLDRDVPENPEDGLKNDDDWSWSMRETKTSEGVRSENEVHYLTPDEISRLVDAVPSPKLRNSLIVKLLYNTGVRRGELAQLQISDIDRDDRSIHIPAIKSPTPRRVTYDPDYVAWELEQWLDRGYRDAAYMADSSDYVFPTNESEHISGYRINSIVTTAAENAGLQSVVASGSDGRAVRSVTAHTVRHSYAVQAIKSGIDVRRLAEILGHKSTDGTINLETTMIYLRMAERDYVEESRKFEPHE